MTQQLHCIGCGGQLAPPRLELGALPPCNRFGTPGAQAQTFDLTMAICARCALVQLCQAAPAGAVAPRVPWIFYNEPDGHLDTALDQLAYALGEAGTAVGVGPFDRPLLDRLARRGWSCASLDLLEGVAAEPGTYPYLETLQAQMTPARLQALANKTGKADLVVCRYLLEHSHDPAAGLRGLAALLKPGGRLMIEVPESTKFLSRHDYSFVWEEHFSYFTRPSLARMFDVAGCASLGLFHGEGLQEDLLLAVVSPDGQERAPPPAAAAEIALFTDFVQAFGAVRQAYRTRMAQILSAGGQIALFGAGHQAVMFANALRLMDYIAHLADDHPDKLGTCAPGADGPIVPSAALDADPALAVCLLSTNPRIEDKIRAKLGHFLARGGQIYSIFSGIGRPTLIDPTP